MEERRQILERVESGEISVEEAVRRLEMVAEPEATSTPPSPPESVPVVRPGLVQIVWQAVFWSGVVILVGGALLLTGVYAWGVASGWLACAWPLLAFGVLVLVTGWWMRTARWFSLRVREEDGSKIALALPLPLGPAAWLLRIARPFVPQLRETGVDQVIEALQEELEDGQPVVIDVDDQESGDRVQVYFG
ncbi:MAG: hypothetical protein PVI59_05465 [Anaerolineae bacterium]|jgi:hypothetical protein